VTPEDIVDQAEPRRPVLETTEPLHRATIHLREVTCADKTASGSGLLLYIVIQVFPAQAGRDREAFNVPGIHAIDTKIRF